MNSENQDPALETARRTLREGRARGTLGTIRAFTRLSGPGWLQSAITLGGGSLSGSLYLGVIAGLGLLWLQPLAMLLGVVMLAAIARVTLTTKERPFAAIRERVNPALAWGWALATLLANLVWCLPQFSLGTAALRQNLLPGLLGPDSMSDDTAKCIVVAVLLVVAVVAVFSYRAGGAGVRWFERALKVMVGVIVLSFFGVAVSLAARGQIDLSVLARGLVPDPTLLVRPAEAFSDVLGRAGDYGSYWSRILVDQQRDVLITAAATAVGINMTFLLPYSMLRKGWDREFRGLAIFDLCTGLLLPFALATGCVVVASATQFHAKADPALVEERADAPAGLLDRYRQQLDDRLLAEHGTERMERATAEERATLRLALPLADREMAAMIVKRDAFDLARALEPLTGHGISHVVFGVGVLGMALSTILMLMLINGFVVCEMLGVPEHGNAYRLGALLAGLTGALGPFLWSGKAAFWLAVPTSVFGMMLLPIAYATFFLMMNSRALLGDERPRGSSRFLWNLAMGVATALATLGAAWSVWSQTRPLPGTSIPIRNVALVLAAVYLVLVIVFHRRGEARSPTT